MLTWGSPCSFYMSSPTVETSTTFVEPGTDPAVPPVRMTSSPSLRCPASLAASIARLKRSSREPACSPWMATTPHTSASILTVCSTGLMARILLGGLKRATLMQESPVWVEVRMASASRSSELAGRVGNGVVAVAPPPGSRGRDVPPVVDCTFGSPADPLHLLHALLGKTAHGRLPREHHG